MLRTRYVPAPDVKGLIAFVTVSVFVSACSSFLRDSTSTPTAAATHTPADSAAG